MKLLENNIAIIEFYIVQLANSMINCDGQIREHLFLSTHFAYATLRGSHRKILHLRFTNCKFNVMFLRHYIEYSAMLLHFIFIRYIFITFL